MLGASEVRRKLVFLINFYGCRIQRALVPASDATTPRCVHAAWLELVDREPSVHVDTYLAGGAIIVSAGVNFSSVRSAP